jgi:hypothetical protein
VSCESDSVTVRDCPVRIYHCKAASYSAAAVIALSKVSIMVKQTPDGRSPSDFETFDEGIAGDHQLAPLFLSGNDDRPDLREFTNLLRKRRPSVSSRILASVLVASAVAIGFALLSSGDIRNIVVDAKVSIAAMLPAPFAAAQPDVRLTAEEIELLKDPARLSGPANQTSSARSLTTVATEPPREEITSAVQSATQSQAPAAAAPATAATKELSDAEKEALFKQFLAWEVERNARAWAQVRPQKAKSSPPPAVMLSPSAGPPSTR